MELIQKQFSSKACICLNTYCGRDRSHCQSSKKHICCDSIEVGHSLPEGITYCIELLGFISVHLEFLSYVLSQLQACKCCVYILC